MLLIYYIVYFVILITERTHRHPVPKIIYSKFPDKTRVFHSWSKYNGIWLVFVPDRGSEKPIFRVGNSLFGFWCELIVFDKKRESLFRSF